MKIITVTKGNRKNFVHCAIFMILLKVGDFTKYLQPRGSQRDGSLELQVVIFSSTMSWQNYTLTEKQRDLLEMARPLSLWQC